jgi:hypothetical protein
MNVELNWRLKRTRSAGDELVNDVIDGLIELTHLTVM